MYREIYRQIPYYPYYGYSSFLYPHSYTGFIAAPSIPQSYYYPSSSGTIYGTPYASFEKCEWKCVDGFCGLVCHLEDPPI